MMQILVIGGTGMVGQLVVKELLLAGLDVTLLVRSQRKFPFSGSEKRLKCFEGDVMKLEDVKKAVSNIPNLTHIYFHPPASTHHRLRVNADVDGTKNLLHVMGKQVHFLKLSEIGAMPKADFFDLTQKSISEELIKKSQIPYTIFRPTWFMESIPQLLTMGPMSMSFGKQKHPIWWLSGVDYAKTVVAAIKNSEVSKNKTYTVQGPEPHRIPDAIKSFNQQANTKKISVTLPLWTLHLPALLLPEYHFNQQIMNYYDKRKEVFESQITWKELHRPTITLRQFAENYFTSGLRTNPQD